MHLITTKFCAFTNSSAAGGSAKFCGDTNIIDGDTAKYIAPKFVETNLRLFGEADPTGTILSSPLWHSAIDSFTVSLHSTNRRQFET